jgi:3-hydroxyisobutyrate dehydrogenase
LVDVSLFVSRSAEAIKICAEFAVGRNRVTAAINSQDFPMKIGICGTGRMGSAIAQRLIAGGHDVAVWNRDAAKTQALVDAGVSCAASPAALVNACDTTIVMLLNDAALQAVYGGNNGLLMSSLSGKLIIDMSTVLPETMISIGTAIIEAGGQFVECPVSGTVGPARDGKLFGLVGGDAEAVRARPSAAGTALSPH